MTGPGVGPESGRRVRDVGVQGVVLSRRSETQRWASGRVFGEMRRGRQDSPLCETNEQRCYHHLRPSASEYIVKHMRFMELLI